MADDNQIVIEVVAKLDTIEKQLSDLQKYAGEQGSAVGDAFSESLTGAFEKLLAIASVVEIFDALKEEIGKSIDASIEAEKSISLLNASLGNAGAYSKQASEDFQEYAESLQSVTSFSKDLIVQNASVLASLGGLSGDGLKNATKAALDFAASGRVSVETAFNAIAKAANGNTDALKRYGVSVDNALDPTSKFANALQQLNQRFGGLAEAQGATFGGALDQIKNQFLGIEETIGNLVTKSPVVVAFLSKLADLLNQVGDGLKSFGSNGDPLGDFIKKLLVFGQNIVTYVIAPLEFLYNIIQDDIAIAKLFIQGLVVGVSFIADGFLQLISAALLFGSTLGSVVGFFNKSLGDSIKTTLGGLSAQFSQIGDDLLGTSTEQFAAFGENAGKTLSKTFNFEVASGASKALDVLTQTANDAAPLIAQAVTNVAQATVAQLVANLPSTLTVLTAGLNNLFLNFSLQGQAAIDAVQKRLDAFKGSINSAFNTFATGFAQSFAKIGSALVKGENLFQAFGQAILGVFGTLAIQTGTAIFLMGLGTFNPGQIAAGLALIALGGVLQALSGGSSGSTSASTSDTGASTDSTSVIGANSATNVGGGGVAGLAPDQNATIAQGTKIAVNVQGNVYNQRDTALEIATILQNQFDNNGQILAQGNV